MKMKKIFKKKTAKFDHILGIFQEKDAFYQTGNTVHFMGWPSTTEKYLTQFLPRQHTCTSLAPTCFCVHPPHEYCKLLHDRMGSPVTYPDTHCTLMGKLKTINTFPI
jgi:hypothetical protein